MAPDLYAPTTGDAGVSLRDATPGAQREAGATTRQPACDWIETLLLAEGIAGAQGAVFHALRKPFHALLRAAVSEGVRNGKAARLLL